MIKRILEISSEPYHVSVRLEQLTLRAGPADGPPAASVPCEDIGVVIVDNPAVTYSHYALVKLAESGAAVVLCGANHQPAALVLAMPDHSEVAWRVRDQVDAPMPVQKRLWQQIIRAKINNQAAGIPSEHPAHCRLQAMAERVRSGDPDNFEAQAARIYWDAWRVDPTFHREPGATDPVNSLLNYGYAVLRAGVARAIVAAGLAPALGLHHRHRANAFCLADDLMEPMRPWVDAIAMARVQAGHPMIDRDAKAALIGVLNRTVKIEDTTGPLMVGLHRTCASLVRCLRREETRLLIPTLLPAEEPCT